MNKQDLNIDHLKLAVFDWDNTLAKTRDALVYAVNQILPAYHLPPWDVLKKDRKKDLSFKDNFFIFFQDKADEAYEKYKEIYRKTVSKMVEAFPKTHETLDFLRNQGISLMIMSNKDRALLEYELPLIFNPAIFDNIVCGHEALRDKPFPEHLHWTVKDVFLPEHISPENVWVIGDSPQDSTCALRAGARAIRIGCELWEDETSKSDDVVFFENFDAFYQQLILSNPSRIS